MATTLSFALGVISRSSAMPCRIVRTWSICFWSCLRNASKKSNFCWTRRVATSSWRCRTRSMISATRSTSRRRAASVAATRSFVTPASAETTTIGLRGCRSATISMAFATRSASPTLVPPNLMTIIATLSPLRHPEPRRRRRISSAEILRCAQDDGYSQEPFRFQQLRVQQRRPRRAAYRVVDERDHADVKQRARTDAADADGHAALAVAVEARLRAVGLLEDVDRMFRRAREPQLLRDAAEVAQRLLDLVDRRHVVAHRERDRHQMAVDRRHAVRLRGDAHRRVDEALAVPRAEDLARLDLDLLFLAADVRNDVVEDGQRRDAVPAGAGDGLHGGDVQLLDAPLAFDRRDGEREAHRGAVRVRDDVAAAALPLLLDRGDVIGIDLGEEQRDVGAHAVVLRVGDDDAAAVGVVLLGLAGDGRIEATKEKRGFELAAEGLDGEVRAVDGERRVEAPVGGVGVALAVAALGRDDLMQAEPGVVFEELDEALADGAGGAEDGDGDARRARGSRRRFSRKRGGHAKRILSPGLQC